MIDIQKLEHGMELILKALGIDRSDPNFNNTPERVARLYQEILTGMEDLDAKMEALTKTAFPATYKGIVTVKGIEANGLCPHHFLPVGYKVDIGYIPKEHMIGLSKLPRMARLLAARPVMQEQFTDDLVNAIYTKLDCSGAIVVVRGSHSCMRIRGVKDAGVMTTSAVRGVFSTDDSAKQEFLRL